MKYIRLYPTQDAAVGTTADTPFVGTLRGSTKVMYAPTSKFGVIVNIVDDGDGFIKGLENIAGIIKLSANGSGRIIVNYGLKNADVLSVFGMDMTRNEAQDIEAAGVQYYAWGARQ